MIYLMMALFNALFLTLLLYLKLQFNIEILTLDLHRIFTICTFISMFITFALIKTKDRGDE